MNRLLAAGIDWGIRTVGAVGAGHHLIDLLRVQTMRRNSNDWRLSASII